MSWRNSFNEGTFCDQSVIDSGKLMGESGNLVCQNGCSSQSTMITDVLFMCTGFSPSTSTGEDWSFGERRSNYTFDEGSDVTMVFTGAAWIDPFDSDWSILTSFSMARRNDTGRINSTPRAITSPVLRLQANCNHTIRIPVTDPDNDIVRCRWAVGDDECGGICGGFPGADLDPESCSITYTANQGVGYRAAAIVIEDFLPGSTVPMSSVGLQFLVLVLNSTRSCSDIPEFIPPTPEDDSCVAIPPGGTFHTMLVAVSGNENDTITEIQAVSPAGLQKSNLFHDEDSNAFYVNITWTPTNEQENATHLVCYTAISVGLSSSQVCIKLLPGYTASAPIPDIAAPNMELVNPSGTTWRVNFDRDVERPSTTAYITFHEFDTDVVVHRIDTSSSSEIVFVNGSMIALTPVYVFEENKEFYINFDRGVVVGVEGCRPGNEPVTGRFYTFIILDITPEIPETPGKIRIHAQCPIMCRSTSYKILCSYSWCTAAAL